MIDKVAWIHLVNGKVLSTRSHGKDVYYLPGGKREPGESDTETLAREVREELTVRIDPATARHVGTFEARAHGHPEGVTVRMTCYTAEFTGDIQAASEIAEVVWSVDSDREHVSPVDRLIFSHLREQGLLDE
ncbi:NUDIX domain-containing protein [Nocardia brasiliensis]|uniref:NUDIX domain-containing protein n=1 Tax=Nocardia brasiliensis TaxID=37326 RepID=A0A6G9XP05_NOCBR|nr:NUDIX domain-containing protein [Nocardia brasiliensis]QIS02634.1 NUDIX domain-containing protein [Nocardia brasiliensis]